MLTALALVLAFSAGCASRQPHSVSPHIPIITPAERPGLGTGWGETRASWVEPATFARAHATRPDSKGLLFYNDREGINAMLDYLGGEPRAATGLRPAGDVSFGLRGGDGHWLESYELKGKRLTVGERAGRYEVVVKNDSPKPVEVLVTVDGLDTLDGDPARFDKRGFVVDPAGELVVDGFRFSDGEVGAFRFSGVSDTVGQRRHGKTDNVGVVGVMVFREGRAQPPTKDQPVRPAAAGAPPTNRTFAKPPAA